MGKDHTSCSERERTININFPNKNDLIQLVVDHLAYQYSNSIKRLKEKSPEEYKSRKNELPSFKEALKKQLKWRIKFFKKIKITYKSVILKRTFAKAKIKGSPEDYFSCNIEYEIKGLEFKVIKKKIG